MIVCPAYEDLRFGLVTEAMLVNQDFEDYSNMQKKMSFLLSDSRIVRSSARICTLILEQRCVYVCVCTVKLCVVLNLYIY